jgi:bacterioferritin-associated ferredoxin
MGKEALEAAVFNWAQRRGVDLAELGIDIRHDEQEEGRLVCTCFGLTEPYILRKIRELELHTIPDITNALTAGGACMSCHHTPGGLPDLLDQVWGSPPCFRSSDPADGAGARRPAARCRPTSSPGGGAGDRPASPTRAAQGRRRPPS